MPRREKALPMLRGPRPSQQRQRLDLARAVYSQKELLLLDDVLSGLDNDTEKTVFDRVLGPHGLLREQVHLGRRRVALVQEQHTEHVVGRDGGAVRPGVVRERHVVGELRRRLDVLVREPVDAEEVVA